MIYWKIKSYKQPNSKITSNNNNELNKQTAKHHLCVYSGMIEEHLLIIKKKIYNQMFKKNQI